MTMLVRRLDTDHDMTWGHGRRNLASGLEATTQRLRCRLLMIRGEWFLDTDAGVPWWQPDGSGIQPILGVTHNLQYAEAVLKATILETDGVATLDAFSMQFDSTTRKLDVTASGLSVDGGTFNVEGVAPQAGGGGGSTGVGAGVPLVPLVDTQQHGDDSGAEVLATSFTADLTPNTASNITLNVAFQGASAAGTATFRAYVNGVLVGSVTRSGTTLAPLRISGTVANPGGIVPVTVTIQSSGAGVDATIDNLAGLVG